jgi:hypothetical protein
MANNPLRTDSNGTANALRSKLQGLGAGTYDPEFAKQYRTSLPPAPNTAPFIPNPNPAENKSQLVKKKMLIYSGDRDDRVGSTASDFQITLNTTLDDVVKLELRSFQVPRGIFNVLSPVLEIQVRILWNRNQSDLMRNHPAPAFPHIPATITTSTTPASNFTSIYITAGAYTWEEYANAWAKAMDNYVKGLMGVLPGQDEWITAMVNDDGNIEFYTCDDGLQLFILTSTPDQVATGTVMGLAAGTTSSINTGGVYGAPGYYYLIAPNQMTLQDLSVVCVQSIALGNNLVATEGGSAGFNAFATIPIPDQASPILVRFDTTLDSTYFEPSRRPYNTLKVIDFKITDKDGRILNLRSQDITMEFDVVQKITPLTQGT